MLRDRKYWMCICKMFYLVKKYLCNMGSFCKKKNKVEEKGGLFRRRGFCYNFFVLYVNFEEELVLINMIFMILIKGFCFFLRLILKRRFY